MKKTLLLLFALLPIFLQAQNDPPIVAMGTYETDLYQWSFTMGDLAILTLQTNEYCWTQGSQQPVLNTIAVHQPDLPDAIAAIFPNPCTDFLFCTVSMPVEDVQLKAAIFDVAGRYMPIPLPLIQSNVEVRLSLMPLPAGSYFIAFSDQAGRSIVKQFQKL